MPESYDDFQIKPLTKGLGFHKKAIQLGEMVSQTGLSQDQLQKPIPSAPPEAFFDPEKSSQKGHVRPQKARESLDRLITQLDLGNERMAQAAQVAQLGRVGQENEVSISSTLPRYSGQDIFSVRSETMESEMRSTMDPVSDPLSRSGPGHGPGRSIPGSDQGPSSRRMPNRPVVTGTLPISPGQMAREQIQTGSRRSAHDSKGGSLRPASISISSTILDFVVVVALSLVFLVSLLSVTKIEILSIAFNLQSDGATQLSLGILFIAIMQMYVVVSRSFFGRTLGEWTFDFQMGDDQQQRSGFYPLLVAWRSFLIVLTGLIILPLLSLVFRRDLTARLCGLQLYRRV